ncbi:hypothetical protein CHARACLAT_003007 [Characodon lateralis]|uniref:Uncharacterized protein n=1 Tax=Characodon lateralis TaxID=208331 RepID=A0ABU7DD87_9TELE|nr:hypothetical protein [Characodon lateralis]
MRRAGVPFALRDSERSLYRRPLLRTHTTPRCDHRCRLLTDPETGASLAAGGRRRRWWRRRQEGAAADMNGITKSRFEVFSNTDEAPINKKLPKELLLR